MKTAIIRGIPVVYVPETMSAGSEEMINSAYGSIPENLKKFVIFDFTGTSYINSSGLAALIAAVSAASSSGNRIVFSGLNGHAAKVMALVGLLDYVTVFNSTEDALKEVKN